MVIWITGLSGAGKSTLARAVATAFRRQGLAVAHLDGDALRAVVADPATGHDRSSRLTNAHRITRMAALLESQGLLVVVSTMSLFHEIHELNRRRFSDYLEVLVHVDLETLHRRDPQGHYRRAAAGQLRDLAGFDLEAELPEQPDLILDNRAERRSLRGLVGRVVAAAESRRRPRRPAAGHSERPIRKTPASTSSAPSQRAVETPSPRPKRPASRRSRK